MILRSENGITESEQYALLERLIDEKKPKKVLILPPDMTRLYSGAGELSAMLCRIMRGKCEYDVMPALGTHEPMTKEECDRFFLGEVRHEDLLVHDWRSGVIKLGEIPAEFVREVSEGLVNEKIDVETNRRIINGGYDLILSIGQVVPHEVVGMANYSKNIFVGCGGASMINASHMLGAFYGIERILGRDRSPVRKVFDYAQEHFLKNVPLTYILTSATVSNGKAVLHGLYVGSGRDVFEAAVADSRRYSMTRLEKPLKKAVVFLEEDEFKSTWLGNKAIYRTRMAMADGGELIILAPGVKRFGEDAQCDRLIRKYGYCGRENVLRLIKENEDLRDNLSAAAHLIHGSSDGRFRITYCTRHLTKEEVNGVCFGWESYDEAVRKYDPDKLKDGYNTLCGEEIFYISNPALGLWYAGGNFDFD